MSFSYSYNYRPGAVLVMSLPYPHRPIWEHNTAAKADTCELCHANIRAGMHYGKPAAYLCLKCHAHMKTTDSWYGYDAICDECNGWNDELRAEEAAEAAENEETNP